MRHFVAAITLISIFAGCNSSQSSSETIHAEAEMAPVSKTYSAYCIWDKISVRKEGKRDGDYLTSIYLGEKVSYLDSTSVDESGDKPVSYKLVKLSDGSEGWVQEDFIAISKEVAVLGSDLAIHERPNMVSITEEKFNKMDYVVIEEITEDWARIKGKREGDKWFKSGWVEDEELIQDPDAILECLLLKRALQEEDGNKRISALENLVETAKNNYSQFTDEIENYLINDPALLMPEKYQNLYKKWFTYADMYPVGESQEGTTVVLDEDTVVYSRFSPSLISFSHSLGWAVNNMYNNDRDMQWWGEGYSVDWANSVFVEAVQNMSGINPVIHGQQTHSFAHVNPEIVKWASRNLIPNPNGTFLGTSNTELYENLFGGKVEAYATAYIQLYSNDNYDIELLTESYMESVHDLGVGALEYLYTNFDSSWEIGFWIRREMDSTRDEFFEAMCKFLKLYNPDFYEQNLKDLRFPRAYG